MKALILAAGQGTRLGDLTTNKPKGMVDFFDKSIIEHQINLYTKKKKINLDINRLNN